MGVLLPNLCSVWGPRLPSQDEGVRSARTSHSRRARGHGGAEGQQEEAEPVTGFLPVVPDGPLSSPPPLLSGAGPQMFPVTQTAASSPRRAEVSHLRAGSLMEPGTPDLSALESLGA